MDSAERPFTTCVIALLLLAVGPQIAAQAPNDEQREAISIPAAEADEADHQARIALDLPIERRSKIAHQQYGATSLDQQDGDGFRMVTVFANGRHDEGGFFCAEMAIIDANDQLMMRIRQRAGVGASTSWKPMRKRVEDSIDIDLMQARQIETVEIAHYACRSVGKPAIRSTSQALAGDVISDHGGEVANPPQMRTRRERLGLF